MDNHEYYTGNNRVVHYFDHNYFSLAALWSKKEPKGVYLSVTFWLYFFIVS